jgi:hypothetical protein
MCTLVDHENRRVPPLRWLHVNVSGRRPGMHNDMAGIVEVSLLLPECEGSHVFDRRGVAEQDAPSRFTRRGSARGRPPAQAEELVEIGRWEPGIDQWGRRRVERCCGANAALLPTQNEAATPGVQMECHPDALRRWGPPFTSSCYLWLG